MNTQVFINLPVKNVEKTKKFFSSLGFTFNPKYSNEKALCMIISEGHSYAMLLQEEFFKTFTSKPLADATKSTEVLSALALSSKEAVDGMIKKAVAGGASEVREPQDLGFMYSRSFSDLDGHIWEFFWMDEQ